MVKAAGFLFKRFGFEKFEIIFKKLRNNYLTKSLLKISIVRGKKQVDILQ